MNKTVIATVLALITIIGAAFGVDSFYVRKADADERAAQMATQIAMQQRQLAIQEERDRIEVELQTNALEQQFLLEHSDQDSNDRARESRKARLDYLRHRQKVLEERLLKLRDKQ